MGDRWPGSWLGLGRGGRAGLSDGGVLGRGLAVGLVEKGGDLVFEAESGRGGVIGRNRLSRQFSRRIALATGVDEKPLLRGHGRLTCYVPFEGHPPFSQATFEKHRARYWGRSDEEAARQHLRNCADALGLIFVAATRSRGKIRHRLPAVVDSFIQWCERTREDFRLDPEIQEQLEQRKAKLVINHTYGQWRTMQKEDPAACRAMGFKDDPAKGEGENLRLETETIPIWRPGYPMRGADKTGCEQGGQDKPRRRGE